MEIPSVDRTKEIRNKRLEAYRPHATVSTGPHLLFALFAQPMAFCIRDLMDSDISNSSQQRCCYFAGGD